MRVDRDVHYHMHVIGAESMPARKGRIQVQAIAKTEQIQITNASTVPTVYANLCNIQMSTEEVILNFALRNPSQPTEAQGLIKVYTNLAHAKRIMETLSKSINQYEAVFGRIDTDPIQSLTPDIRKELGVDE